MLEIYSGDPFLARRAALQRLQGLRQADATLEVVRLSEGIDAGALRQALDQGGLFGRVALLVDLDEAFPGAGHTAARNAIIDVLAGGAERFAAAAALALVIDAEATPARQKRWRELGTLHHQATPRYGELKAWLSRELRAAQVEPRGDVVGALIDLFGDDLPGMVGELQKLQLLEQPITPERVRQVAQRPAARSAFDLIDAVVAGDRAAALRVARQLLELGEVPIRVMAALVWQVDLLARGAALLLQDPTIPVARLRSALGVAEFVAKKVHGVARHLDEPTVAAMVAATLDADVAMKRGTDPEWALERVALQLAGLFAKPSPRSTR
jgi:DNA polymerase III subunit delta